MDDFIYVQKKIVVAKSFLAVEKVETHLNVLLMSYDVKDALNILCTCTKYSSLL